MDYLLGIDLGSTSLKAIVYDLGGNRVASGSRPTRLDHPNPQKPEWAVWQPEHIWHDTAAAIRDAVSQLDDPRRIRGLAVTGMGMDGLPVDADGRWLYPMISWHDSRTLPQLDWWKEHVGAQRTFAIGGNPVWPINSALRIRWIADNEPALLDRAEKWLLIEDFLNLMLCGRMATDYSMASCTMLFDQRRRAWSDELIEAARIPRRLLPDVFPSGTPLGEVHASAAAETGLPAGTPVILGGHDHLCGALPVGACRPGVILDVTGTWESVIATVAEPVLDDRLRQMGMTVQSHVARGVYAVWGGNPAGGMLEWYREQFGQEAQAKAEQEGTDVWAPLVASAAASPPGAGFATFLPHMSGAGCPMVDEHAMGALVGLTNRTTAGDVLRAMIEGLDFQFCDIVTNMEAGLATRFDRFLAVGGAVRNELWMQNKADVLGRPIEVAAVDEASPLGAAILAGIGVGLYRDEEEAFERVGRPGRTFQVSSQ
ncbi:MAG: FGGY family carbohydrate kinase [Thermoguttaceae bacterium]|jgi:xylulokinase|nr:FGGY family carbohydrate kinase [Thermoguttaceae bacterium]